MTGSAVALRRFYDIHGVGVEVRAGDPNVLGAVELRLRGFASDERASPPVLLDFVSSPPEVPAAGSRPMYDMPDGALHYFPVEDAIFGQIGDVALCCRPSIGVARFHCAAFASRALYLATHPLLTISLMTLLERRGLYSLHAGCMADSAGSGVVLAGPSGAGKSTLALALTRAGMSFLSDDVIFLELSAGARVQALGFADTVGVTADTAARFPELAGLLEEPAADGFPKRLARIEELFSVEPGRICEPRAIVFPEVAPGSRSAIAPLDPGDALLALVPDVLLTEPGATQAHLAAIAALLGQVRCFALRSGADLDRAAELVRAVL